MSIVVGEFLKIFLFCLGRLTAAQKCDMINETKSERKGQTMGIYDGYLLCVDFDGTVAEGGKIVPKNVEALRRFEAEGGFFTICTGRQPSFMMQNDLPVCPNAPLLAMNGTILYDMGEARLLRCWTVGRDLWEWCEKLYLQYPEEIASIRYYTPDCEPILERGKNTPEDMHPYFDLPLYKVIVIVHSEFSDRMLEEISASSGDRYHVSRSWIRGIELQSKDSGKGVAVNALREMLGNGVHTVVCAGDYENDISMLRVADISYAVGNAVPAVKAVAMRQTIPCGEGAIAQIIQELAETH
jgi:hydroxymethylpyrimidine pyrophosphatase-like HAD family hydrolase